MADDRERERLTALTEIAAAEASLFRALWERFKEWASRLRNAVFGSHAPGQLAHTPDPDGVWSTTKWWGGQAHDLEPVVEEIWTDSFAGGAHPAVGRTSGMWSPDGQLAAKQAAQRAYNRLVNVPETVFADIRRATLTAVADGHAPAELAAKIERILGENDVASWRGRALTIARTEALAAYNGGRYASYVAYAGSVGGAWEKIWLATHDHRTRTTHTREGGGDLQRVPLQQHFVIGGAPMLYPGDPEGPPDETINCRCSILLVEPGEHVDLSDRHYRSAK